MFDNCREASILLYLLDQKDHEASISNLHDLKGHYYTLKNVAEDLEDQGFIKIEEDLGRWAGVKAVLSLTEEGEILANEIKRVDQLVEDLRSDQ